MNLLEQLQNAGIPYTENEPMSRRTTFGIGRAGAAAAPPHPYPAANRRFPLPGGGDRPLYFGPGQQSAGQR